MKKRKLDGKTHREIMGLCAEGDDLAEAERFPEALLRYRQALALLPDPPHSWEAATWIYAALGDALLSAGDLEDAQEAFEEALRCPEALGNPFLHLRLGQLAFEAQDLDRAADELCRGFMAAGPELFEEEDPKYFAFLKTRMDPPAGGWGS